MSGRVLIVTNDFPPRRGGIESFVASLCAGLPPEQVVVHTARMPGSQQVDAALPYSVVRDRSRVLLPTPRVARRVVETLRDYECDKVLFGASAPLGLLAPRLRAAGARHLVAMSHGHEVWWARAPVTRTLLYRIGRDVDVVTYVSEYCRERIASALPARAASRMQRLAPFVDHARFSPEVDGSRLREQWGIAPDRPVVLSSSRLVARKGHDVLLAGWPRVLDAHPEAALVIVGSGPRLSRLHKTAERLMIADSVRFVPAVPWDAMPEVYAAAQIFALPCRTRLWGLEPEALGIVFLEASASRLPVVVGRSGGAPETVRSGETGYVVDPDRPEQVSERLIALLDDRARAERMGAAGRQFATARFSEQETLSTLRRLLHLTDQS